jgi:hypothetical protein
VHRAALLHLRVAARLDLDGENSVKVVVERPRYVVARTTWTTPSTSRPRACEAATRYRHAGRNRADRSGSRAVAASWGARPRAPRASPCIEPSEDAPLIAAGPGNSRSASRAPLSRRMCGSRFPLTQSASTPASGSRCRATRCRSCCGWRNARPARPPYVQRARALRGRGGEAQSMRQTVSTACQEAHASLVRHC